MEISERKRILTMLATGRHSQAEVAAVIGCSKRDVSECARFLGESGMGLAEVEAMSEADAAMLFVAPETTRHGNDHLRIDAKALVECKSKNVRLPFKLLWAEHCEAAAATNRILYSCSRFCEIFFEKAEHSPSPTSSTSPARRPTSTGAATRASSPTRSPAGEPRRTSS